MAAGFSSLDIESLANLLKEVGPAFRGNRDDDDDSDTENDNFARTSSLAQSGPGNIGAKTNQNKSKTATAATIKEDSKAKKDNQAKEKDIWSSQEIQEQGCEEYIDATVDPRKTPVYETYYRQSVATEDVFLQMGNKTPGTASCENLVVEISLPQENFSKVQLNLKKQVIDLRSPMYFLNLGLPHPIDPRAGNAKWDQEKEKLTITLKLARQFDDLNF